MAKWHLTVGEALAQMMSWEHSVSVTRTRILDPAADRYTRSVDAQLFAMALRQVLRFAMLCRAVAPRKAWSGIDLALNRFNATSPDAKSIRDVLDHWDAYLRGEGTEFPAGPPGYEGRPDNQIILRPADFFYEHSGDTYRLHITPAPGQDPLVLDVTRDTDAAVALGDAIRAAVDAD